MRSVDTPEPQPTLPPPVRKPVPATPEQWTAIGSTPGYERNQHGNVRKKPEPSIHDLYKVQTP